MIDPAAWSDDAAPVLLRVLLSVKAPAASWTDLALCAETDAEAFFPEKGGSVRDAKTVCRACPVRAQCLEYALEHDVRFGVWGGLAEHERRKLRRGRAA